MTVSTTNATSPKTTKSRNSNSLVKFRMKPTSQFQFVPRDTGKSESLDLVDRVILTRLLIVGAQQHCSDHCNPCRNDYSHGRHKPDSTAQQRSLQLATSTTVTCVINATMGWLRLVGSFKSYVPFAKEPYKRDYILQKRRVILTRLLIVAAQQHCSDHCNPCRNDYFNWPA